VLAHQFLRVAGFVDGPDSFFRPSIIWRVLRGSRAARRAPVVPAHASELTPVA